MSALYRQVCQQILARISAGELGIGQRLPPESEYAEALGISRSTLRLAFAELEATGVLRRRKRAGAVIIADRPQQRFNMATTGIDELLSLGRDTVFAITAVQSVPTADVPQLQGHLSETGHWLEVSGIRALTGDATPFSVNRVYVPVRYAGIEPLLSKCETSVFRAIESTFDISVGRVSQVARAMACPEGDARTMGLATAVPVLQIEAELYSGDGLQIEISLRPATQTAFRSRRT